MSLPQALGDAGFALATRQGALRAHGAAGKVLGHSQGPTPGAALGQNCKSSPQTAVTQQRQKKHLLAKWGD